MARYDKKLFWVVSSIWHFFEKIGGYSTKNNNNDFVTDRQEIEC